jgi:hypothetical protein
VLLDAGVADVWRFRGGVRLLLGCGEYDHGE